MSCVLGDVKDVSSILSSNAFDPVPYKEKNAQVEN